MIAVKEFPDEICADVSLPGFRRLIDFIVGYGATKSPNRAADTTTHTLGPTTGSSAPSSRTATEARGVKFRCEGEADLHGPAYYVSVDVTKSMRTSFGNGAISAISARLGMPLRLWKYPISEYRNDPPGYRGGLCAISNPNVAFLMMAIDPTKSTFGWAPPYRNNEIGNPMIEDVLEREDYLQERGVEATPLKHRVVDYIAWDNMVKYWEQGSDLEIEEF
ncbi:hypothetical protein BDW59DRAFT_156671 [Aspergillus cavernicola]|uniref:Uncharacterized protein n=1 Tax=Aspergillus cavernicola TaxID=176166 RepID=A0ABR4J1K6_9EURO